ncbi:hypothetical protein [Dyadobacter sp. CY312]|uniref:hypothetical protein n=1 Tax=Dyadobacter sp. CY312 TaxID=2907303 RepID=UPI001F1D3F8E|nr:hypothetical protein [Dyadobacter sp. CY312]MCE7038995.1 hypothetical protein [Dyadobacter sp. CY312]
MAGDVSASNIRIGASIQGLLDGLKRGSSAVKTMTFDMNNRLADAYRRANKEQSVFRGGLLKLGDDLQGIAGKMAMIGTLPTLMAAGKAFKDYSELEKLEKGLTRYGETLETVREIAKLPNIGVFDAAKSLISLKAMKMSSDLATRSIKAFANAITDAGGSAVDLEPALVNLRQFQSTKHINQVDLRQLAARMPQTMDAMQGAFKTQDTEELNKKMSEMGSDAFIDKFIKELEKIPKAGGGAATAMEQLGDSFLFFSASIGKGIDETFKVSEKLHAIGGVLDNLSTNFANLTPEAQKSIFAVGAIAVVMPAVVGAIGGLIKLLPLLATGFGLISAPIAATIAVVGIAAAAIITQWDSVKAFLVESTWWNTLVGAAKSGLGMITETFKVVINFIQGDWGNMGKALVNIFKNSANLVLTAVAGMAKGVLGLFGTFNEAIGFDALGKGISKFVKGIDPMVDKMKFDVPDSFSFAKEAIGGIGKAFTGTVPPIEKSTKAVGDAADAQEKLTQIQFELWSVNLANKYYEEADALEAAKKKQLEYLKGYKDIQVEMAKPIGWSLKTRSYEDVQSDVRSRASSNVSKIASSEYTDRSIKEDATKKLFGAFEGSMDIGKIQKYFAAIPRIAGESLMEYEAKLERFGAVSAQLSSQMSSAFKDMAVNVSVGFGEMLGDLMTGIDGLDSFAGKVVGALSGLLKEMGKAMIAAGTAGLALKLLMKNPALTLAAGIGLVAVGQALNNNIGKSLDKTSMTAFADGGFAHKDMIARVGDNRNARFDPEMIAPYSKVDQSIKKSISESGGRGIGQIEVIGRISGSDILLISDRARETQNAIF